jgi:hypothetical protein
MIAVSGRDPEQAEAMPGIRWRTLAAVSAAAAGGAVILLYFASAARLLAYPWDWSPNEGLVLDCARRLVRDPLSLYPRGTVVPSPDYYGPFTALLLAPAATLFANPWPGSRLVALLWSVAIGAGVYGLVRQRGGRPLSLLSAALVYAPLGLSCFYMVLRADGPMIALWLWAAYLLLPRPEDAGRARLGRGRELGGAALLVASVLCKPTAALHGAPIVLAWLAVDRRRALRLAAVVSALGLAALVLLQLLTGGGYLAVMGLWRIHQTVAGQWWTILAWYFRWTWPVTALAAAGLLFALRAGGGQWRDPALALWVGGALLVPGLRKGGASFNYLLPWLCATAVLAGRYWSARRREVARAGPDGEAVGALVATAAALLLVQTQTFPLPTAADAATARSFYGFIADVARAEGGPILATTADYAYYQLGQPVEVEGSSLPYLVAARAPGVDTILHRLQSGSYSVVAATMSYWPWDPAYTEAAVRRYRPVGVCRPGFFFGAQRAFVLSVRRESRAAFAPAPGARCELYAEGAPPASP